MKTGLITFDAKDRAREHRGEKRNYDTVTLAKIINGPEVQERVRNRDLHGYFGHYPRVKFGVEPPESVIVNGKLVLLDSAFVTTHLVAHEDGTIEHEAETLENTPGRAVADHFQSKVGGFSGVIRSRPKNGYDQPVSFHGFDFVREPNFSKNRPYTLLDSADGIDALDGDEVQLVFDDAVGEYGAALEHYQGLYANLNGAHLQALQLIEKLSIENNEYLSRIAAGNLTLDSASGFVRPLRTKASDRLKRYEQFRTMPLVSLDTLPNDAATEQLERAREDIRSRHIR